ncbi:MAG: formyltetrahydrofolate deformylase [Microthrixaceae bacterium]
MNGPTAILLLSCPDQPGVVAAVADFVWRNGGNIVDAEQHTDHTDHVFFQRIEFELDGFGVPRAGILEAFAEVSQRFEMNTTLRFSDDRPRTAVLSSRAPHCLVDLLSRNSAGELPAELALVASNHVDHADLASAFGVPFHHVAVDGADEDAKAAQEQQMISLLQREQIDLVVLARYMRILSADFIDRWPTAIVNIHHSFLPAFVGARPYAQAHERGVKVIGATAHYATAELDAGPIIDQDVTRVSHRDDVPELTRRGRDLEVVVLARALRAHLEHRVLVWGNRTVVFS